MDRAAIVETSDAAWSLIEEHFRHHAALVRRFERASGPEVASMWERGRNERGEPLSPFERAALVERYCELFGRWPADHDTAHIVAGQKSANTERCQHNVIRTVTTKVRLS